MIRQRQLSSPGRSTFAQAPTTSTTTSKVTYLEEINEWSEDQVATWLNEVNCAIYSPVFVENNINGNALLECDQQVLKELGITKVGDRMRIFLAIKELRKRCFQAINTKRVPEKRKSLLPDSIVKNPPQGIFAHAAVSPPTTTTTSAFNSTPSQPLTPKNNHTGMRVNAQQPSSPTYLNKHSNSIGSISSDTNGESFGSPHQRKTDSPGHSTGMSTLPSNTVKFIGDEGQTRIVNISDCSDATSIINKALKKFSIKDSHEDWCIFVTEDVGPARIVEDEELVQICQDALRPERERLILKRKNTAPSIAEFRRAQEIAQEQQVALHNQALVQNINKFKKIEGFFGEKPLATGSSNYSSPGQSPAALNSPMQLERRQFKTPAARIKQFFGARPPSELISSNLSEYFPNAQRGVLEKTVRNSVRRSHRMSRASTIRGTSMRRLSNGSTWSYQAGAPPIPTVGDNWLKSEQSNKLVSSAASIINLERDRDRRARRSASISSLDTLKTSQTRKYSPSLKSSKSKLSVIEHGTHLEGNESGDDSRQGDSEGHPFREDSGSASDVEQSSEKSPEDNPHLQLLGEDQDEHDDARSDYYTSDLPDYLRNANLDGRRTSLFLKTPSIMIGGEELDEEEETFDEMESQALEGTDYNNSDDTFTNKWIKGALIGQGSFGSVVLGMNGLTGELMAVKQVDLPRNVQGEGRKTTMLEALQREIALLRVLQHENIVQYLGSNSDDSHLNIFLEYVPGGSVTALLGNYGAFEEPLIRNFVRQILQGLNYLHEQEIIHRDIKGANILVDNKGVIKISDFGISKKVETNLLSQHPSNHRPSLQGSVYWMAPEVVKQTQYTRKADIWSLGCLVVEMFTGQHPFPEFNQMQAIFKIGGADSSPDIPQDISAEGKDFLNKTFELDHVKRPTAAELLIHPFLNMSV